VVALMLLGICTAVFIPIASALPLLAGLMVVQGISFGLIPASVNTLIAWGIPAEERAIGMSIPVFVPYVVSIIGATSLGLIADSLGLAAAFVACSLGSLAWLVGFLLLRRQALGSEPAAP
jgi:hypothetical protein